MSAPTQQSNDAGPLDLSRWRNVPNILIGLGAVIILAYLGLKHDLREFGFSWLQAFMFFLSLGLGGLGMVILHHLFDANWSVPIRRMCEHLACLLPWMLPLFVPILFLAPRMYEWMVKLHEATEKHTAVEHAIAAKLPLFTPAGFYVVVAICFGAWWLFSNRLRHWSLEQDKTGSAHCTVMMRRYAATGVVVFAITLTLAAIMWMKALMHEWFSTMYGVWYFAASMWTTLYTLYFLTVLLKRHGPLKQFATEKTFYMIGSLMFAFTVFYAYVTFFQYFIIWNANMPEETFWFVRREVGSWWYVGMLIIFGHFFLPFLLLLRIDVKVSALWIMLPLGIWAWLMHFVDISWNIMPALRAENFTVTILDLGCMAFIGGVLTKLFLKQLHAHPIVPLKDPRFAESMDIYVEPEGMASAGARTGGGH